MTAPWPTAVARTGRLRTRRLLPAATAGFEPFEHSGMAPRVAVAASGRYVFTRRGGI